MQSGVRCVGLQAHSEEICGRGDSSIGVYLGRLRAVWRCYHSEGDGEEAAASVKVFIRVRKALE